MKWLKTSNPFFLTSLLLFAVSLFFSGFYIRDNHQPYGDGGFGLLLSGWLGIFNLHLSWLANPLYFLSLKTRNTNPEGSFIFAIIGFLMTLEFLLHKSILTDEGGGTAKITGLGWGYYLWLMSFITLAYSSIAKARFDKKPEIKISLLVVATITTVGFSQHYFLSVGNHFSLVQQRDKQFAELCSKAGENFYSEPSTPITGIYFSERGGPTYRKFIGDRYSIEEGGVFSNGGISNIPLVEFKNDSTKPAEPYIRKSYGVGPDQPTAYLKSNYLVMIERISDSIPKELNLASRKIVVLEQGKDQPLASMLYVVSRNDNRFCGILRNDYFSEQDFVFRALKLIK